jgi:hypothetical protein
MYRDYENVQALEHELELLRKECSDMEAALDLYAHDEEECERLETCLLEIKTDIYELEARINFANQDEEE